MLSLQYHTPNNKRLIYKFEIKEMTTLLWNFELLQLISKAKIRYNSQNTTTKNSRKLVKFDDKTLPCRAVDGNCEG